jgi:hypothetical protein
VHPVPRAGRVRSWCVSFLTTQLNKLPSPVLYLLFATAWVGFTLVVDVAMRRRLHPTTRTLTGPTAAIMLTVLANLYAILIAFVIVQGWSNLGDAQAQVGREATALSEMFEDSHALPAPAATEIQDATRVYARSVLRDDWKSMADDRKPSPSTTRAFHELADTLRQVQLEGKDQPVFYQQAVARLNDVDGARQSRLDAARGTLPTPLYLLLVAGGAAVVVISAALDSRHRKGHLIIVSIVAAIIGCNLALVVSFDHPFSGGVHVTRQPIVEVLASQ